eukprot:gene11496-biopygen2577
MLCERACRFPPGQPRLMTAGLTQASALQVDQARRGEDQRLARRGEDQRQVQRGEDQRQVQRGEDQRHVQAQRGQRGVAPHGGGGGLATRGGASAPPHPARAPSHASLGGEQIQRWDTAHRGNAAMRCRVDGCALRGRATGPGRGGGHGPAGWGPRFSWLAGATATVGPAIHGGGAAKRTGWLRMAR